MDYSSITAINRPHAPDEETADFIFKAYQLLKEAPPSFGKWARQGAFENIAACALSWLVVGISEDAVRKIASTGKSIGVQRGHWFPREQRYELLFGSCAPKMDREGLVKFFFDHDTTILITKEQNDSGRDHTTWGRIVPVPEGLFPTRGYTFAVRKSVEIPWVESAVAQLDVPPPGPR